jgi:hypothetical protein
MAPHLSEELWEALGHRESLAKGPWPTHDEAYLVEAEVEIVVQVMGKLRGKVLVPPDAAEDAVRAKALADPNISRHVEGKTIRKVIYVPGRLITSGRLISLSRVAPQAFSDIRSTRGGSAPTSRRGHQTPPGGRFRLRTSG